MASNVPVLEFFILLTGSSSSESSTSRIVGSTVASGMELWSRDGAFVTAMFDDDSSTLWVGNDDLDSFARGGWIGKSSMSWISRSGSRQVEARRPRQQQKIDILEAVELKTDENWKWLEMNSCDGFPRKTQQLSSWSWIKGLTEKALDTLDVRRSNGAMVNLDDESSFSLFSRREVSSEIPSSVGSMYLAVIYNGNLSSRSYHLAAAFNAFPTVYIRGHCFSAIRTIGTHSHLDLNTTSSCFQCYLKVDKLRLPGGYDIGTSLLSTPYTIFVWFPDIITFKAIFINAYMCCCQI